MSQFDKMSLSEVAKAIDDMRNEISGIFDAHKDGETGSVKFHEISPDDTVKIRDLNAKLSEATERFEALHGLKVTADDLEQIGAKLSDVNRPGMPKPQAKRAEFRDAGALFVKSDAYKSFIETGRKDQWVDMALSALMPDVGGELEMRGFKGPDARYGAKGVLGTDNALADVAQEYPPEVLRDARLFTSILAQPPNIADLCVQVPTTQNAISYMEQTTRTQAAAETAEGAAAPESSFEWTPRTDPVRKIIHTLPVTDELLADEGFLRGIINSEMRQGVLEREDRQLLLGDGVGQNLDGILNRAGVQNVTWSIGTDITAQVYAEKILRGHTNARQLFRVPSATVLNAFTWEFIRLAKDSQNNYLFLAGIQDAAVPRLWGVPVATNENMADYDTNGNIGAVTGPFATDAYVARRTGVELAVSDSHSDRFARDVLTIKARERVALAVLRPAAFTTVTTAL